MGTEVEINFYLRSVYPLGIKKNAGEPVVPFLWCWKLSSVCDGVAYPSPELVTCDPSNMVNMVLISDTILDFIVIVRLIHYVYYFIRHT